MTFIWLSAPHVLIDSEKTSRIIDSVGAVMVTRYGGESAVWARAYQQVRADWDSYYADLDLAGDDGLDHLWEGMFRTTRALFRLTNTLEPPKPELTQLARTLIVESARRVDLLHNDVKPAFVRAHERDMRIGVYAPVSAAQINGWLIGGGVREWVDVICGFDTVERFRHDRFYWETAARIAQVEGAACIVVDTLEESLTGAREAGMRAIPFAGQGCVEMLINGI